jgi:hypothetical protein
MTPFKTNQQLNIERREKEEKSNALDNFASIKSQIQEQTQAPLLEFKLNQPQMASNVPMAPNQIYPSPYVPIPNPYYPLGPNPMMPWQYTPNNVPVIKKYNISLGNGNGDITKLASLYEDILPSEGNVINNTFNTLKERKIIHHWIRSIFIKTGDGEELLINGGSNNSGSEITNLLSHVKLLEINPYHYNKLTDNPYKTLPVNFVMYRSCYPIKLSTSNIVECSKSSIGMNVRIYLLSKYDDDIESGIGLPRYNSDIWRELDYYQFVREEIIKRNISPNFITLHSYYMTKNTGINFKKFDNIRKNIDLKNLNVEKTNANIRNNLYAKYIKDVWFKDPNEKVEFNDLIKYNIVSNTTPVRLVTEIERSNVIGKKVDELILAKKLNHNLDSDKCLVMLSEAPTQHMLNWATRTYQVDSGPVKKMIHNGYHDDKVWESIFFQLLLAMIIMFEKEIMFSEFSLENNVYIKDLKHSDQSVGIWKYTYGGIDYFVSNYGYLLLIDSNFKEISSNSSWIGSNFDPTQIQFRIKSSLMKDQNDQGQIYKLCLEKMIDVFSSNNFESSFTHRGGVAPTSQFLSKLNQISAELRSLLDEHFSAGKSFKKIKLLKSIKELPINLTKQKCFNMLHSRFGTPIKDQEKSYLSDRFDQVSTKIGSIVAKKNSSTMSTFAIYLGQDTTGYKILSTDSIIFDFEDRSSKNIVEEIIDQTNLLNYFGQPEHSYEPGKQYNILESYLISLA